MTWHPDVSVYKVRDHTGELLGLLFLDLFTRPGSKEGGAWKKAITRRLRFASNSNICQCGVHTNFTPPESKKEALLTPDNLKTLFHEFGHALHEILSRTEIYEMGGTRIARDVLEFPSTFMELFAIQPESLKLTTRHYQTHHAIPPEMIRNLIKADSFGKSLKIRDRAILALFDMRIHMIRDAWENDHGILLDCFREHAVFPVTEDIYPEAGFSHIFQSDYDAGF